MNTEGYHLGSCIDAVEVDQYDYVFTGIPCYEDLAFFGVDVKKPESYKEFLDFFMKKLKPRLGTVTIGFTGHRRNNSRIAPKFFYLNQTMFELGYFLRDCKYYSKTASYNAYSSTMIHIYTFQHKDIKGKFNLVKQKLFDSYGPDIWFNDSKHKEFLIDGELIGQDPSIPRKCILNFTDPGDTVLDPFAGIGTTLAEAAANGRKFLGYEIRESIHTFGKKQFNL